MERKLVAKQSVVIDAPAAKVWDALTNPEMIRQYLFGTEASSEWKAGSQITYKGVWQGKPYEDRGTVIKIVPERLLETTYWSGMSGVPDLPENRKNVTYELLPSNGRTTITVMQDNNATEKEKAHMESNWKIVLESLKTLLEAGSSGT
jgi:uncharacterized protein YndB with AHSA1/START domain